VEKADVIKWLALLFTTYVVLALLAACGVLEQFLLQGVTPDGTTVHIERKLPEPPPAITPKAVTP
jgi:predicted component of type VI protein secretion system